MQWRRLYLTVAVIVCLLVPESPVARGAPAPPGEASLSSSPMTSATATSAATGRRRSRRRTSTGWRATARVSPMPMLQASVCTPTRYSLMTGQYAWRQKPGGVDPQWRGSAVDPKLETLTLPKLLKQAGYATGVLPRSPGYVNPLCWTPRIGHLASLRQMFQRPAAHWARRYRRRTAASGRRYRRAP